MLKTWKQQGFISDSTYNFFNFTNPTLPRTYALSKIHKSGNPLRITISSIGSLLHNLAFFLHGFLDSCLEKLFGYVKNSFQLIKDLVRVLNI